MARLMNCIHCRAAHEAYRDEEGYWIVNCPKVGAVLAATPNESNAGGEA